MKSNFMLLQAIKNLQDQLLEAVNKINKNEDVLVSCESKIKNIDNTIDKNTDDINTNKKEIEQKTNELKDEIQEKIDNIKIRIPKDGKDGRDGINR